MFLPPLNNFATRALKNGNFTATVNTKIYPEADFSPFNSFWRSVTPASLNAPAHHRVLYLENTAASLGLALFCPVPPLGFCCVGVMFRSGFA